MRCVTRRSNSAVVSVCWPVIVSSIGSMVIVRFGCFGSGLASFDSSRARNTGSLPVCATRLSVASASAFSKVCGSDEEHAAEQRRQAERRGTCPRRRRPCRHAVEPADHLHSRLKKSVSAAVIFSSEAFCRISVQRAWRSCGDVATSGGGVGSGTGARVPVRAASMARRYAASAPSALRRGFAAGAARSRSELRRRRCRRRGIGVAVGRRRGGRTGSRSGSRSRRSRGRSRDRATGASAGAGRRGGRRDGGPPSRSRPGRARRRPRRPSAARSELDDERGDADQREGAGDHAVERALARQAARAGGLHPRRRRAGLSRRRRPRPTCRRLRGCAARRRRSRLASGGGGSPRRRFGAGEQRRGRAR